MESSFCLTVNPVFDILTRDKDCLRALLIDMDCLRALSKVDRLGGETA